MAHLVVGPLEPDWTWQVNTAAHSVRWRPICTNRTGRARNQGGDHEKSLQAFFNCDCNCWRSEQSRSAAAADSSGLHCAGGIVHTTLDRQRVGPVRTTGNSVQPDLYGF